MATPRKHWFRVADSVADEDFRNDELAFLIRLMAALNTQWARNGLSAEDACQISLSESALMSIADVRRPDAAMGILARLQQKLSIDVELVGTGAPGVYFVHSASAGLVKIGMTTSLWQRIDALKRERSDIELIGWIPTFAHAKTERELHAEFAADRVEGEWFRATAALLKRASDASGGQPPRASQSRSGRLIVAIRWEKWSEFQGLNKIQTPESRPLRKTPPQDARRKTQEEVPETPSAPPAPRASSPSKGKVPCPEGLDPEAKERLRAWAQGRGIDRDRLTYGWQAVRDWAIAGNKRQSDWEATFRNALRKGWCLEGYTPPAGAPSTRYRDADQVIAEAKRKQAEDEARARTESPEEIGNLIDLALRKASA